MPNAVLVAANANSVTENAKFRFEYQVVGAARGNFDWAPTFGLSNAQLLQELVDVVQATIFTRHGIRVQESEIIILGAPTTTPLTV